jgi:hypothetical protein
MGTKGFPIPDGAARLSSLKGQILVREIHAARRQ